MLTQTDARKLVDRVLARVRATKGAEAIVAVHSAHEGNTRFAVNEISTSADVERLYVRLSVQLGQRQAAVVINQPDDHAIEELVGRALQMARLAPENPEQMPPLGRQAYAPAKNAADEATGKIAPDVRAKAAGVAIAAAEAVQISSAGYLTQEISSYSLGTTAGLFAHHVSTSCGMSCTARTPDGTGSGWAGVGSNRISDLDPVAIARAAVDKAVASARPRRLDPGRYTVVLEPAAVGDLLAYFATAMDARRADESRSFFSHHKVGEKLFPETISLRSDPSDPALSAWPFDAEGLPRSTTRWIDKGVLTGLPYSRFWARKQGKQPTARPHGWVLDGDSASRDDLIKGVKRGVLITRFYYLSALDPQSILVTGLTRDGVFLIENGAIAYPVNNFRFNESPVQMLARCDALGSTAIPYGSESQGMRVPGMRTHEFNLASISEAV